MSEKTEAGKRAIIANLQAKTGKDLAGWLEVLASINQQIKKKPRLY